jgi:hypothetical protein
VTARRIPVHPCGHVSVGSACLECAELDRMVARTPSPDFPPVTIAEGEQIRAARIADKERLERVIARLTRGDKKDQLKAVLEENARQLREVNEWLKAERVRIFNQGGQPHLRLVDSQVEQVDDGSAEPMSNAAFLRYVAARVKSGHEGPIARPKVRR